MTSLARPARPSPAANRRGRRRRPRRRRCRRRSRAPSHGQTARRRPADVRQPPSHARDAASTWASGAAPSAAPRPRPRPTPRSGAARALAATQAHSRIEDLKATVHAELLKQLGPQLYDANIDQDDLAARVRQVLKEVIGAQERPLSSADRAQVTLEITDDILGDGPIEPLLNDPEVD